MALFGKPFKITLGAVAIIELLSLIAQLKPTVGTVGFLAVILITLVLTLNQPAYGLYVILGELFIGSQGHLLEAQFANTSISLRIGLFIVVLGAWLWQRMKTKNFRIVKNKVWYYYLALFLFLAIGLIQGLLSNDFSQVFFDVNAWLYFVLILAFFDLTNPEFLENTSQILLATTSWLALKTVIILLLFSHSFATIGDPIYQWIRNTRIGEITFVSGTIFRVFFQSQIYILIGFLIILTLLITQWPSFSKKTKGWLTGYLYLSGLALIISQSRSFWVGGVVAGLILLIWRLKLNIKKIALVILLLAIMLGAQILTIQLIAGNFAGNIVGDRFKDLKSEAAGISRINQLKPLTDNISQRVLLGYGFGKTLTYQSSDPRVLADHPDGIYTTYAFEWGYLDIALKIGVLGLMAYLTLIGYIFYQENQNLKIKNQNDKLKIKMSLELGLVIGLIALLVTNVFSPYLNHPLGIGYIILLSAVLLNYPKTEPTKF